MEELSKLAQTVDKINDVYSYMFKDTETNDEKAQVTRILEKYKPGLSFREGLEMMKKECEYRGHACDKCKVKFVCDMFWDPPEHYNIDQTVKIMEGLE